VKLGIFGGSFNPVHYGHFFLVDTAISMLKLDRVVMIPAFCSPFKPEAEGMEGGANDRLDMLAAAAAGDSRLAIDDCEIRRGGVSYTVDTIEDIISRYIPGGKPALIIGDDLAADFPKWRDSDKILELADIVIVRRKKPAAGDAQANVYRYAHTLLDNEIMDISSHAIRQKIKQGMDWRSLVPSGARVIIEDRRLYGYNGNEQNSNVPFTDDKDCSMSVILRIEEEARRTLTTERFLHSRNTALLAHDLCRRFGINPTAGYLAGIAHDLAKQTDSKILLKIVKDDGLPVTELEKERPNLLHGRAAAVLLKERFCIHNKDVLEAVAFHTSGKENMSLLAKVVYIADKVEVSRNIDPALRKMCVNEDLDSILYAVLKKQIGKLQSRELKLSEDTLRMLNKMKEKPH
jgi:nicotinate (nicotinamide) nucleotide adenylyltransferase